MEDRIEEIGIDEEDRLYVKPSSATFPVIYREAMEVHWNSEHCYLYGAKASKWGYLEWFHQIIRAASEQGCKLTITQNVSWFNVPSDLQKQIIGANCSNNT